jgi:D-amino-acid oxidase
MEVTVVGAGVIGLTTALALEEHGHAVRVVTAAFGETTTSAVAGAVWFPYRAGPPAKVARWAAHTRTWLEALAQIDHAAGVDVLTGYEITHEDGSQIPWWAAAIEVGRAPAPVTGAPMSWRFTAPRAEPARLLPYLASKLRAPIEHRSVIDLSAERGDVIVNCTGLAARELATDDTLYPLFGQIVIAECGAADLSITITDHRDPDRIFYIIPRRGELVLGGCSLPYPPGAPPAIDPDVTTRILGHARSLGIPIGAMRTERVGLRPYRLEVRLERDRDDPRIIHNYGHGGAGFTLCRGCAEEVVALVAQGTTTPLK